MTCYLHNLFYSHRSSLTGLLMTRVRVRRWAVTGNKFCKIFSHYEFLVQLVFAPHFKQRHIPRYKNDKNRKTHVESTRAMTRERGARAESKNCEILLFPTADRRFDTKVKCPTGRASFWVKFPTVRSLTRVKCPGIARGGRLAVLELTGTLVCGSYWQ